MSPDLVHRARRALLVVSLLLVGAAPARALRIVDYNFTNFPSVSGSARIPRFAYILSPVGADVIAAEEILNQTGSDKLRDSVLNVIEPGQWAAAPFLSGNDTNDQLFYKPSKVQFLGNWAFYPNAANHLRLVHVFRLKPVGYSSDQAEFRVYVCHLKASTGSTNEAQRAAEAQGIRDSMNAAPAGTHMILTGDFNCYRGTEPALTNLSQSTGNNIGQVYDPLGLLGLTSWNTNASISAVDTQCPCLNNCPSGYGFSGGGLDDRFDLMLGTNNMNLSSGLGFVAGSYVPIGNDNQHFNTDINISPTNLYGQAYADSLIRASDHLPIRMDLRVPGQIGPLPFSPLAFGTVIVGAPTPTQVITVGNVATAPASPLTYSFSADAGFGPPVGTFSMGPGFSFLSNVTMDDSSPGVRSGNLHIASNDVDFPNVDVALSGTVLAHAAASLDSVAPRDTLTINFGYQEAGQFTPQDVRVHNLGWSSLQAKLDVGAASINSGDGRFSIAGGFSPVELAGVGRTWSLVFDDTGATPDSTYEATLTFNSADEALPGGQPRPDLTVTLLATAKPSGPPAGVPPPPPPTVTRLYAPAPNPLVGMTTVHFDLAHADEITLAAFDASGRRVATLMDGHAEPGRYSIPWRGRDASGAGVTPGLYFLRLSGRGIGQQTVRLALLR